MGPCPEEFGVQQTGDYLVSRNRRRRAASESPEDVAILGDAEAEDEAEDDDEAEATLIDEGFNEDVYPGAKNGAAMYDRGSDFFYGLPDGTPNN